MTNVRYPEWRWDRARASVSHTGGPQLHRDAGDDEPPYEPPRIRLGFAPPARHVDEPLTWEGDQA